MGSELFVNAEIEAQKENYEGAVEWLNKLIENQHYISGDVAILHFTRRAEYSYKLNNYQDALRDLNIAISNGFDITKLEKFFLMFNHCKLQCEIDHVIGDIEKQSLLNLSWDCSRLVIILKNIKLENVFLRKRMRERAESADRYKRK